MKNTCFSVLANRSHFGLDISRLIFHDAVVDTTHASYGGIRKMPRGTCPECAAEVQVDEDMDKGDIVECPDCGMNLEVVGLDPIELDIAMEDEEEDWTE